MICLRKESTVIHQIRQLARPSSRKPSEEGLLLRPSWISKDPATYWSFRILYWFGLDNTLESLDPTAPVDGINPFYAQIPHFTSSTGRIVLSFHANRATSQNNHCRRRFSTCGLLSNISVIKIGKDVAANDHDVRPDNGATKLDIGINDTE
uniref:Uncharacterized protein n=1 Tax=Romanomermis culicivorax TaxID=13658 RepID=A0A915I6V5_ROMCU